MADDGKALRQSDSTMKIQRPSTCLVHHLALRMQDKEANRKFVDSSGFRDRSVEQDIIPVQTAVYKLAKAGSELEKDDAKSAAATLSSDWVGSFESAGKSIAATPDTIAKLEDILVGIKNSAAAAGSGKLAEAKTVFVATVEAVEIWVVDAGVAGQLKGL
jgi:hypothetical protein